MARLGDLIEQIRGVSYKPEDVFNKLEENCITLLRANNIKDGQLNFDDVIYVDKKRVRESQLLRAGDILICTSSGSKELVGKAAYVTEDLSMTFGAFCKVVRPKKIRADYLGHFFNSPNYRQKISDSSTGANINNIRNEHIDELKISLPTIDRQKYVVVVLDKISNLISLRKQQLAKLDESVKSRFLEMFGDPLANDKNFLRREGKELFVFSSGKFLEVEKREAEGVPVYGGNGVAWHTNTPLITTSTIVIGRVGAYCGNVRMVTEPAWITDNAIYIKEFKTDEFCLPFLLAQMGYMDFSKFADFSGQPKITQRPLEKAQYIVPPMGLQQQFIKLIEQIDESKLTIQQSLDKLKVLKKSLMQQYFGEVND